MNKMLLGILMQKRMTIYEIRKVIKFNFKSMCSDSLGGIHAALRKLLDNKMITYKEYIENGISKKVYSITDIGREEFNSWLNTTIDMNKSKNIDLSKLLFMGMVPTDKRANLIGELIEDLKIELEYLKAVQKNILSNTDGLKSYTDYLKNDEEYSLGIASLTQNNDLGKNVLYITEYEQIALQFGIDTILFQIEWFKSLKEKQEKDQIIKIQGVN